MMKLKPLLKEIDTRGRKREARRWPNELDERCAAMGASAAGHDLWWVYRPIKCGTSFSFSRQT